uniref:Uncharacterized protein n=1 Tax=Rhizophora mucronata TaxID=61149 RepID=A0A2P2PDM9_RHIMU
MSIMSDSISSTGENRVLSRYQPGQRLSQGMGYPTGYHPQAGTTDEQRWQSPGDFAFSNLQGPSTNQPHRRRPWSS